MSRPALKRPLLGLAGVAALLLIAVACTGGSGSPPSTPEPPEARTTGRPDLEPLVKGPVSAEGLQAILATADLGAGLNRFGVLLTSPQGIVDVPSASITARRSSGDGSPDDVLTAIAEFRPWPLGLRGLYTTELSFDRPGKWAVTIEVRRPDGAVQTASAEFEVHEAPMAPAVGDAAPRSVTRTLADAGSRSELTTGTLQDEDFYRITLAEALGSGRPTVVVFASPAFCTNAVCGPQIEVLKQLKDARKGQANFVHVDFFDNPHEVTGNIDLARLSPAVVEWQLPGIEWTFVADAQGIITHRFEAFATLDELESALRSVL